jgi:hypothetical protein
MFVYFLRDVMPVVLTQSVRAVTLPLVSIAVERSVTLMEGCRPRMLDTA